MNEELKVQAINIDEISDIGQVLPNGKYYARLSAVNAREGKDEGAGTVEAVYDVLQGPLGGKESMEGMEIRIWYSLKVTKSAKNQKIYAPGISEMKQTFAAVGSPLQSGFPFPTDPVQACKVYGTIMHPTKVAKVEIAMYEDSYIDAKTNEKKIIQRKKVLGIPGGSAPQYANAGTTGMGGAGVTQAPLPTNTPPAAPAAAGSDGNILAGLNLT